MMVTEILILSFKTNSSLLLHLSVGHQEGHLACTDPEGMPSGLRLRRSWHRLNLV